MAAGVGDRLLALGVVSLRAGRRQSIIGAPGGETALRASVWELMRPMLSPALVALNRDAFLIQGGCETTVDLAGRHAATSLDDLDLDELSLVAPNAPVPLAKNHHRAGGTGAADGPARSGFFFFLPGWSVQHVR